MNDLRGYILFWAFLSPLPPRGVDAFLDVRNASSFDRTGFRFRVLALVTEFVFLSVANLAAPKANRLLRRVASRRREVSSMTRIWDHANADMLSENIPPVPWHVAEMGAGGVPLVDR